MKSTSAFAILAALVASTSAHMSLLNPTPRGGYNTPQYNGHVHTFIGYKDDTWTTKFPCGGFAPGPVTTFKAGDTVNVRFAASSMNKDQLKRQPDPEDEEDRFKQARHSGGTCEFSLSYDGGETYHLIGRYTRSCPDAYYMWPVKIPDNVPSCNEKTKCLFVWSWTASILPQYYHNCADVVIQGVENGTLPATGIQIVDFPPHKMDVKAPGDDKDENMGDGPNKAEKAANLGGEWK
ncbi:hypothetical protein B0O80DRAFT_500258 [Mortierella sp. GBAus27b]|nr:hypothetical protein BGX31_009755 [Mortierella sp. GBA43]KAI8351408.1 hypothetical protein B0O80DRAFT_500258 [Mortierella sp. GBAus27b]